MLSGFETPFRMCYHVWLYSCIRSIYRKLSQQFWNCKFSTCTCTDLFCVSLSLARESYQKCCTFFIIIETHSVEIQLVQLSCIMSIFAGNTCWHVSRGLKEFRLSPTLKTACTEIGGGSGRRTDMTFLDFWSTSSALYVPASFEPSSGS